MSETNQNALLLDTKLMQSIRAKYGAVIASTCAASSVPQEFLAALIANETGGDPTKKRFEKNVLADLWDVLLGRKPAYGSIKASNIFSWLPQDALLRNNLETIDDLSTSWGLTQIMGYEIVHFGIVIAGLQTVPTSLQYTCRMLADFAARFQLDLKKDFEEMFRCWNGGRPHAQTFDPAYVANGLRRLAIYRDLQEEPPGKAIST